MEILVLLNREKKKDPKVLAEAWKSLLVQLWVVQRENLVKDKQLWSHVVKGGGERNAIMAREWFWRLGPECNATCAGKKEKREK